jgi:hypothetical protein
MWTQLGHYACSLSVRGKENLKTAQSERPCLMSRIVERVFVPRLNSPNRRLLNGRCWRRAVVDIQTLDLASCGWLNLARTSS